jgi:hypothetical protein
MRILLLPLIFLFACVSSAKHQQVSRERLLYMEQLKKMKIELSQAYQQINKQKDSITVYKIK